MTISGRPGRRKGYSQPQHIRDAIAAKLRGRYVSPTTRLRMSEAQKRRQDRIRNRKCAA